MIVGRRFYVCGSHLLRDLTFIVAQLPMMKKLLRICDAVNKSETSVLNRNIKGSTIHESRRNHYDATDHRSV